MNRVPVIRKGSIKDYWSISFGQGWIFGILIFLMSLINNSVLNSFFFGLIAWGGVIALFIGVGFTSEEYFIRRSKIKKLNSIKYDFLDKCNFTIHQDLYFEGMYGGFYFRVLPMTKFIEKRRSMGKKIEYVVIESFYQFESDFYDSEKEKRMCGEYFLGQVHFSNQCAGFIPKDWEIPNFKENFDGLISIFKRENLKPIFKEDWENTIGNKMKMDIENKMQARTKQILKIGKLDIKHIKPDKKVSR